MSSSKARNILHRLWSKLNDDGDDDDDDDDDDEDEDDDDDNDIDKDDNNNSSDNDDNDDDDDDEAHNCNDPAQMQPVLDSASMNNTADVSSRLHCQVPTKQ